VEVEQSANKLDEIKQRINFLNIPVDIVAPENLGDVVFDILKMEKEHNIVLLSLWDLLRARRRGDYRNYVSNATLIIPISKSLINGIKFLTGKKVPRYMPFDFIISLLTILEKRELSCYLLGGRTRVLLKTEKYQTNIPKTANCWAFYR
jgi:N-acetylglucosaminyldiphosphoundecaprenol N-acetyl-beta-D-mannosaminyltransferase